MKPASLAALVLRFIAIYLMVTGVLTLGAAMLFSIFTSGNSGSAAGAMGLASIQVSSPFGGLYHLQVIMAVVTIIAGLLLCLWSRALGWLIAVGLE